MQVHVSASVGRRQRKQVVVETSDVERGGQGCSVAGVLAKNSKEHDQNTIAGGLVSPSSAILVNAIDTSLRQSSTVILDELLRSVGDQTSSRSDQPKNEM